VVWVVFVFVVLSVPKEVRLVGNWSQLGVLEKHVDEKARNSLAESLHLEMGSILTQRQAMVLLVGIRG